MSTRLLGPRLVVGLVTALALAAGVLTAGPWPAAEADTGRYAGVDRFATAVAIAQAGFPSRANVVYLARADNFPDALAAGALTGGPILLVPQSGAVPGVVVDEIGRLGPDRVVAVGGAGAVSDQVLADAAGGRATKRYAGVDRFATAVAIAQAGFPSRANVVYLARADAFPDALAAGALTGGPVLLVPNCGHIPQDVLTELSRLDPARVIALGGQAAVCQDLLRSAERFPKYAVLRPDGIANYDFGAEVDEVVAGLDGDGLLGNWQLSEAGPGCVDYDRHLFDDQGLSLWFNSDTLQGPYTLAAWRLLSYLGDPVLTTPGGATLGRSVSLVASEYGGQWSLWEGGELYWVWHTGPSTAGPGMIAVPPTEQAPANEAAPDPSSVMIGELGAGVKDFNLIC